MHAEAKPLGQTHRAHRSETELADGPQGLRDLYAEWRREGFGEVVTARGPVFIDSFLLLLAVCTMLLPTTAGYDLATAAAKTIIGMPFALLMFFSPFALMALLPLRLLQLLLDGAFGIQLRLSLMAPLSLVFLAMFLMLGPLKIRPEVTRVVVADATLPEQS